MAHEHLGLFDTPPSRREIRVALTLVALQFAAFVLILPVSDRRLGEVTPFVPAIDSVIFVGETIIATLLYAQAAVFRSRALMLLASGFVFIALLVVAHALSFPGAFAPNGLFGDGTNTTAWVMIVRRLALPLCVTFYALLMRAETRERSEAERPPVRFLVWLAGAVALAAACTAFAAAGSDWLPAIFLSRSEVNYATITLFNLANLAVLIVAMAVLFAKRKSVLDMWLLVALAGWLIQSLLNLPLHARFTVGWYALYLAMLFAHLFLLVALIGESNRLYARLALATAAQNRERESRLLSLDVMVAAISHEIGQPLAAATLSARSALNSLRRAQPDTPTALAALRDSIDAGHRTFEVMRSMRATFAEDTEPLGELSLNDLVQESLSLLHREFAAQKVALDLDLDEALPGIQANRVQIQRVLVNLLANAIEAVSTVPARDRRIAVRSSAPGADHVLLEIADSGPGIAPAEMAQIFELFFTTKDTGTGLGLSLARTIVQEHGGRLWATSGGTGGATFHLQLRRTPAREQ